MPSWGPLGMPLTPPSPARLLGSFLHPSGNDEAGSDVVLAHQLMDHASGWKAEGRARTEDVT